ncbi:YceI family protein [Mucilaginibacter myungsuensis]|uniref:YceI family protein n=1 Tax=Mucilaginibacter myungsuensis TaxID=649104 RepID=A0A929KZM5_9SPHI|nr:YceI family protein [Mucilaginibacter myungsuensis]MBE9661799.1 YceI family protein [Mucilaginibacter myungsuensis]MDN3599767.1 YceI family protein [Mucilaginibacter myungsuensis]
MKTIYILALVLLCAAFKPADDQQVNLAKSKVTWTGHAETGAYDPTGSIDMKTAKVSMNGDQLTGATIVMDMNTVRHENNDLQEHLKKADFFDTRKYPEAVFKLTAVNGNQATGKLTIKGISQGLSFPFTLQKEAGRITIQAKIKVDRTKFGIKYNSSSFFQDLGSYAIKNDFDLVVTIVIGG